MKKQVIFTLCGCIALQTLALSACSNQKTDQESISVTENSTELTSEENSQNWEILFDNIPWESDLKTVQKMLPDLDLSGITYEEMGPNNIINGFNKVSSDSDDKVTLRVQSSKLLQSKANSIDYSFSLDNHDLIDLVMYFAFKTTEDGYIDYDDDKALLYGINYRVEGSLGIFAEFADKFREEYGEPSQNYTVNKSTNDSEMQYLIWESDKCIISVHNETADILDSSLSGWNESIEISYAWKNGSKLLDQAKEALHNVKIRNAEK